MHESHRALIVGHWGHGWNVAFRFLSRSPCRKRTRRAVQPSQARSISRCETTRASDVETPVRNGLAAHAPPSSVLRDTQFFSGDW